MRISDWSSDVCSSDLSGPAQDQMRLSFGELASAHQTDMRRVIWHDEARSMCIIERIRHGKCIKFPSKRIFRERTGMVLVHRASHHSDRKRVVLGKGVSVRVEHGGRRLYKQKKHIVIHITNKVKH